ncbi:30S ribosome-binding factor RbfA [Phytoactinopolyspora halotolerans]|uniref:Ribosome-binding factor A n=1 Tax=Phytoactinopolyspora halotolerans TaxID=1981512 RepID=A0A6L9S4X8_9ACTN|nr:30S ribosome-binding factor RbfA [Phytoactinopolyspora halotolerans]NEE00033.1 30S ribosome-binding factor RbfA [Phytoactinopolyspora halotolerans]
MADPGRARKLADRIREIAAETLERRVKDPRLGFVTVTDARVTGDLREATVFYTVYGDDSDRAATAVALERVRGLVRSEVGRQTGIRFTPTVDFVADAIPQNAAHIEDLLRSARASDEQVAQAAAAAEYAGDPDPYRVREDDEDDDAESAAGGSVVDGSAADESDADASAAGRPTSGETDDRA